MPQGECMPKKNLSKTKLMAFLQCPRRLYLQIHRPSLSESSEETEARFEIGRHVGEVARSFYPDGTLVEASNPLQALEATRHYLRGDKVPTLFEPAAAHNGVMVRADVLQPAKRRFDLVEVKASTRLKDHYFQDVAIQGYVFEGAGLSLRTLALQHVNTEFVYPGDNCYYEKKRGGRENSLFVTQDLTKETRALMHEVPKWVRHARRTLDGKLPPTTTNCHEPVECEFQNYCYPETTKYPIETLPSIRSKKIAELHAQGYADIRDIPEGLLTSESQERVRRVTVRGKPELKPGAAVTLNALPYPRYYIDFETIQFAVPIWKGTRPYAQLPFQWSCHVETARGKVRHSHFLDLSGDDPTGAFAEALVATVGKKGPVFVYNKSFEGAVLRSLADRYRALAKPLSAIESRLVDLLPITRENYYHPAMRGSWSIKEVLPTIAPKLNYENLDEVQHGGEAQAAYLEAIAPGTTRMRKGTLKKALFDYCKLDTWGMVELAWFLEGASRVKNKDV